MDKQFRQRASHVDGGVEIDESLKPIGNDDIGALMRQENEDLSKVMDKIMETRADYSALDL